MVVDYQSAYKVVVIVLKNQEGLNTVTSSAKCGVIASICTFGGAVLLGPVGIMGGALFGGTMAYLSHRKKFKSLFEVFEEDMNKEEQEELVRHVQEFARRLEITDALFLLNLVKGNLNIQQQLFHEVLKKCISEWQERQNALGNRRYQVADN